MCAAGLCKELLRRLFAKDRDIVAARIRPESGRKFTAVAMEIVACLGRIVPDQVVHQRVVFVERPPN